MAQYPSAVISFTTKNAGDTIQPSHINTMQDEITAIEDGLLNGTAPINSSRITAPSAQITNCTISSLTVTVLNAGTLGNSTLAALSVTGGSTLATLSVSGGSTLASLRVSACSPTARVSQSALFAVGDNSTTRVTFNTQDFISDTGLHSTASNSGKINLTSSGVWLISASVAWSIGSTAGVRLARIMTGQTVLAASRVPAVTVANVTEHSVTTIYRTASTTESVELEVFQNSGSTCSLDVSDNRPHLAATLLR